MTEAQLHQLMAVQAQIATHQARIAYWQSFLASGAYKESDISRPAAEVCHVQLSDKGKRDRVLGYIHNHVELLQELQDFHFKAMREAHSI